MGWSDHGTTINHSKRIKVVRGWGKTGSNERADPAPQHGNIYPHAHARTYQGTNGAGTIIPDVLDAEARWANNTCGCVRATTNGCQTIVHYHDHSKNVGLALFWCCGILIYVCITYAVIIFFTSSPRFHFSVGEKIPSKSII